MLHFVGNKKYTKSMNERKRQNQEILLLVFQYFAENTNVLFPIPNAISSRSNSWKSRKIWIGLLHIERKRKYILLLKNESLAVPDKHHHNI